MSRGKRTYLFFLIAAFGFILWQLLGCASQDMSRDEAIGIIVLDKEMRK